MEGDGEPKQSKPIPIYLFLDEDDNDARISKDPGSTQVPITERPPPVTPRPSEIPPLVTPSPSEIPPLVTPRPSEIPPLVTPRPSEIPPLVTPRPSEIPPLVTPRPSDIPPSVTTRTTEVPPPATTHPQPSKSDPLKGEGTDYEEIPIGRPECEEVSFDRTKYHGKPCDKIEAAELQMEDSPIRIGAPVPSILVQPRHATAMKAVSSSRQLPVRRRTLILTAALIFAAVIVGIIVGDRVIFRKGKDTKRNEQDLIAEFETVVLIKCFSVFFF